MPGASSDVAPKRARSESVPGVPRGSSKVRCASGRAYGSGRLCRGRRGVGRCGAGRLNTPASGWLVCTGFHGARAAALGHGRLRLTVAGWARLARGSMRSCGGGAARCYPWGLNCPTLAGARRVDFRLSAAALARCGARQGVCVARRGGFGLGARSNSSHDSPPPSRYPSRWARPRRPQRQRRQSSTSRSSGTRCTSPKRPKKSGSWAAT